LRLLQANSVARSPTEELAVPDISTIGWVLALLITAGATLVQGSVGMGFAMVSVPALSLIDPRLAPVPQLLVTIPLTMIMAWRERSSIDTHGVGWIIAGRIPGALIGLALLAVATQQVLDAAIAVTVLAGVAILAGGYHIRRTSATKFGAGVASGTTGMIASIGGPPLGLLYSRADGDTVRSSLAAVFTIGLLITLTARTATGNITTTDLWVALGFYKRAGALHELAVEGAFDIESESDAHFALRWTPTD
jgi:uncharacterized membrane protein YfcA